VLVSIPYLHKQLLASTSDKEPPLSPTTAPPPSERSARFESLEGVSHNSTKGDNTHQNLRLHFHYDILDSPVSRGLKLNGMVEADAASGVARTVDGNEEWKA
jgi:hypothetical protein